MAEVSRLSIAYDSEEEGAPATIISKFPAADPTNLGVGAALRTALAYTASPVVCTIDSDCTYPPEHLPALGAARPGANRISVQASGSTLAELHASFGGTRKQLAATLGLSERTLYRKLKELGLD